jgi:SPP1 family predicted phage head-tail adaptor
MLVKISDLSERITVQRAVETPDDMGGRTVAWQDHCEMWAEVKPVKGREAEVKGRLSTIETFLIRVRKGFDITAKDRVVWRDKTLDIRSEPQDRDMKRRFVWFECESGT